MSCLLCFTYLNCVQVSRLSTMSACYRNPHRDRACDLAEANPDQSDGCPDESRSCPNPGGTLGESMTFATLGGHSSQRPEAPDDVPPLGISLDADQMKYLQQQQSHRAERGTVSETHRKNKTQRASADPVTQPDDAAPLNRANLAATKRQL